MGFTQNNHEATMTGMMMMMFITIYRVGEGE